MKLIKPSYKIITPINGEEILISVEAAARDCYQSDGKIEIIEQHTNIKYKEYSRLAISARVIIPKLMNLNHEAMLEFGGMIHVRFIVDRGVSHELVRHRVASFAQESTRYCNYGKDEHIQFIIPNWLTKLQESVITYAIGTDIHDEFVELIDEKGKTIDYGNDNQGLNLWVISTLLSEMHYNHLIKDCKWTPQQARSVLPNSLKTTINISCNIREWRHIFRLRTAKAAHPQMREVMCPLLDEFKQLIPILFDDINY
jgi:thymidylate synthase (FAD)